VGDHSIEFQNVEIEENIYFVLRMRSSILSPFPILELDKYKRIFCQSHLKEMLKIPKKVLLSYDFIKEWRVIDLFFLEVPASFVK
jgi:hypothetical protein